MRVYSTTLLSVSIGSLVFVALGLLFLEPIAGWLEYGEHPWYIGMMMIVVAMEYRQSIPFAYLRYKKTPYQVCCTEVAVYLPQYCTQSFLLCHIGRE